MDKQALINLLSTAADRKPSEFADAFKTAMAEKLLPKLDAMKSDIAQNFFKGSE